MIKIKKILGIDPGLATTGWGLIQSKNGQISALAWGIIKTLSNQTIGQRLFFLLHELEKIIGQYRPDCVAVEKLFFSSNIKTALAVGQARGVILLALAMSDLEPLELTPNQVKQAVATYGAAGKVQVQKMVKLILKLKELPKPDDAADALAIAIAAASQYG